MNASRRYASLEKYPPYIAVAAAIDQTKRGSPNAFMFWEAAGDICGAMHKSESLDREYQWLTVKKLNRHARAMGIRQNYWIEVLGTLVV